MATDRDDVTRYLCAAAHLDDRFADRVIREFLTEPTRAVPPTAGVRVGAVLAEAVAARARRKVRDTLVVVLFCGVLATLWLSLLVSWVLISVVAVACAGFATAGLPDRPGTVRRLTRVLGGLAVTGLAFALAFVIRNPVTLLPDPAPAQMIAVALLVVLLSVLLVDEVVVWRRIDGRFRRGCVLPDPQPGELTPDARPVFLFGSRPFLVQLRRHLHDRRRTFAPGPEEATPANGVSSPAPAPVLVARGYRMFVGFGEPDGAWSLVVPLRPRADTARVVPLTAAALYERVNRAMAALRDAAHLSPGARFTGLCVTEQVVVAAEELVDNLDRAGDFLAATTVSPYPLLRGQRVRELRDNPLEWARYYQRFQIETWDRDLVVSAFLHMAVSDTTLYVEWTPCVLLPVRKRYRAIDSAPDALLLPVALAVVRFLSLPMTMPRRLRTVFSVIRPRWRRDDTVTPRMYGARHSLRELAADTDVRNYFQLADWSRYVTMLESRLMLALTEALAESGYQVAGPAATSEGAVA